jgi:hypothetical protein
MNWWAGVAITFGLVLLALGTLPWGALLLFGLYWVWKRS